MSSTAQPAATAAGVQPKVPFNPLSPEFLANPYPIYERLRAEEPVHLSPLGFWVLSRYDDVATVLRDPRFGRTGFEPFMVMKLGDGPLTHSFRKWALFLDPPDHTRLRSLMAKAFTPKVVEQMRPHIQQLVDELLAPFEGAGELDVVADLAHPLPVMVICEMLGVPDEDRGSFKAWSDDLAQALEFMLATPEVAEAGNVAAERLTDYFRGLIATRRKAPKDDLLSALIAAEEQGQKLSEDELLATCVMLFFGGHETTVNLIGNGTLALLRHPDERRRLREGPGLIGTAIEELVRYDGPVQRTARIPKEDVVFQGTTIARGQIINVLLGAANRDPDHFEQPDRLDIGRLNNRHLTFGGGIHYCIGSPLARVEAQIAINTLLARLPGLELATDELEWRPSSTLRGLKALPVRV